METTAPGGRVTSTDRQDAGRAALAALHEAERRRLSAREAACLRDRAARAKLGLSDPTGTGGAAEARQVVPSRDTTTTPAKSRPLSQHGDVDINGDLVDELRPSRRRRTAGARGDRAARLAACITATTPALAEDHLENILHALAGVPS